LIGFSGESIFRPCNKRHVDGAISCWPWIAMQDSLVVSRVWMGIAMSINAFHPSYVQTYMPQFLSTIRKEADQKANGKKFGSLARSKQPSLENTEFHIYSKAGMPKVKK
jgi:hypothetical protein